MSLNESNNTLNRRKVVKGAAWSVPVIAAAIAAPAASASSTPIVTSFVVTTTMVGEVTAGIAKNITNIAGACVLSGEPGVASGLITLTMTGPAGYLDWRPEGDVGGWTTTVTTTGSGDSTKIKVVFTHPSIAIAAGSTTANVWFPGVTFVGAGGSVDNQARFQSKTANFPGGSNYFPDED